MLHCVLQILFPSTVEGIRAVVEQRVFCGASEPEAIVVSWYVREDDSVKINKPTVHVIFNFRFAADPDWRIGRCYFRRRTAVLADAHVIRHTVLIQLLQHEQTAVSFDAVDARVGFQYLQGRQIVREEHVVHDGLEQVVNASAVAELVTDLSELDVQRTHVPRALAANKIMPFR